MNPFAPLKSTSKIGSQNWFLEIPETVLAGFKVGQWTNFRGLVLSILEPS